MEMSKGEVEKLIRSKFSWNNKETDETLKFCLDNLKFGDRYILFEQYNLEEDFNYRVYKDIYGDDLDALFEDYFSDVEGWEKIAVVDLDEKVLFLLDKRVEYKKYYI